MAADNSVSFARQQGEQTVAEEDDVFIVSFGLCVDSCLHRYH